MSPQLNQSQVRDYIEKAQQGDPEAMSQLVQDNLALVKYAVKRYQGPGREWEDLYQLGCLGLVKAIRNFDLSYPVRFSTYAVPLILGEVRRYLRDEGPMRISRTIRENARRIAEYIKTSQAQTGKSPTLEEMARAAGLSQEETLLALESLRPARYLSEPVGSQEGITLADTVGEDKTDEVDRKLLVEQLLSTLDDKERQILMKRYFDRQTQSQIAASFGMTQVQVSRLENRVLKKLREKAQVTA